MNTNEVETPHQDGPAWKIVGRFPTFAEADLRRNKLLEEKDLQVKIHLQGLESSPYFAVKTRQDPAVVIAEQMRTSNKKNKKK